MRVGVARVLIVTACLVGLTACQFTTQTMKPGDPDPAVTGSIPAPKADPAAVNDALLGSHPQDDLNLGKTHYREQNYGLAEKHFRRAAEKMPRDAEAWLGLAASYDRLRRFELADRAYAQALAILGPTPEVLNNIGYSYLLRGDFVRARMKFTDAQRKAPDNPYIQNNLQLLEETQRRSKGLR